MNVRMRNIGSKTFRVYGANPNPLYYERNKLKEEKREYITRYLQEHPCADCGERELIYLDFDHVRGEKVACISQLLQRSASLETIRQEILKCDIRCVKCHRRRHAEKEGWWRHLYKD